MKIRRVTLLILLLTFATSQQTSARPTGERPPGMLPVTYERLLRAEQEPENWLTYSGQYHGQRYSRLTQINRNNVHLLRVAWVYQTGIVEKVETTPLVVDGVMYLTQSPSDVIALDAKTGRPYWSYHPILSDQLNLCCGKPNRGVAILGDKIYLATLDARLIALDAKSGNVVWDVQIADPQSGYSSTAAPLAVKDKIVTGIAGGEFGIRGFVDAYDAETGKRVWRFHTIPRAGEAGSDTWEGDSWKTGGSPTWVTGSFDPELNLIYWGTGNPSPAWDGEVREGDNLYSNSIVALDADTGKLKWYFQFTPHDTHDWDACQIPVLVDGEFRGRLRKLMLWPNRNAFYYVLDRETGEFLLAREFAKQTWAEKIDQNGRPIVKPNTDPSPEGTLVYPSSNGAANWWSPSYSPIAGVVYVTAYDGADIYYRGEAQYKPGEKYFGSFPERPVPVENYFSAVRALDALTGELKWEYPLQPKSTSGLLSTAGNVLFGGSVDGYFFALDALAGEELWYMNVGGTVHAAPITFAIGGKQYVTIAAGSAIFTFTLK